MAAKPLACRARFANRTMRDLTLPGIQTTGERASLRAPAGAVVAVMLNFDPDVLEIFCPHCRGAVLVQCGPEEPVGAVEWTCPYCGEVERSDFNAPVLWVTKGHSAPQETQ